MTKVYIFKNKNKQTEKQPDYVINIRLDTPETGKDGKVYSFRKVGALWAQSNAKTGDKYMSGELEVEKFTQEPKSGLSDMEKEAIKNAREKNNATFEAKVVTNEDDFGF